MFNVETSTARDSRLREAVANYLVAMKEGHQVDIVRSPGDGRGIVTGFVDIIEKNNVMGALWITVGNYKTGIEIPERKTIAHETTSKLFTNDMLVDSLMFDQQISGLLDYVEYRDGTVFGRPYAARVYTGEPYRFEYPLVAGCVERIERGDAGVFVELTSVAGNIRGFLKN